MSKAPSATSQIMDRLPSDFWQHVQNTPFSYDLFQLLRRIDAQAGSSFRLGKAPNPRFEPIRMGQEPSLSFAPSTLAKAVRRESDGINEVLIYNFGLFGPNGPLPLHLTEYIRERVYQNQDNTILAFTNLFHHRLILLFYRAWANAQPTVSLDRLDDHKISRFIASFTSLGFNNLQKRDSLSDHAKNFLAGHLVRQSRNAEGLVKIITHYFSVPTKLIENVPCWIEIATNERARLGSSNTVPQLGISTFIGQYMRNIQHKFRIVLGPMSLKDYVDFLPGKPLSQQLKDWVRQYINYEFEWDVQLLLKSEEIQPYQLGANLTLGYTSWLGYRQSDSPGNDLILNLETT